MRRPPSFDRVRRGRKRLAEQIAHRAGLSTGNLYRYFDSKDALFEAAIPDELAERFLRIVRRRVGSLAAADDLGDLDANARADAEALLRFWIDHRLEVITLLDRADGSRHAGFPQRFVQALLWPTLQSLRREVAPRRLRPVVRFTLETGFRNTVRALVAILEAHEDEAAIREAFAAFWSYQLAGLEGLRRWATS